MWYNVYVAYCYTGDDDGSQSLAAAPYIAGFRRIYALFRGINPAILN